MSMKLTWNENDITQVIASYTWAGSTVQAARTLDFSLLNSPDDKNMKIPNIKTGDTIRLYDGKILIYTGKVTNRTRSGNAGTVSYESSDYMMYLLRSKGTKKFKNKKPEKIAKIVCNDLKIKIGSIAKTNHKIKKLFCQEMEYYNMILAAYTKAYRKSGKKYMLVMDGTKLSVIKKGTMLNIQINQDQGITESEYTESLDSMVNRVAIYNSKNKKIGTVSNSKWIKSYGIFQDALSVDKGKGKAAAKKMLKSVDKSASITAVGDLICRAGYGIKIYDKPSGLTGTFWIENDTHTFENGTHMMQLELAFKNIMETVEESEEEQGKTKSTGILNGRKVKALFTAYYPANNSMEGGTKDCKGKKLDPSKYTCAAPQSITYGKQIQVLGTGTSRDKKVHKVNDRGGRIKITDGVYHFDLLMKTKSQCNRFGKKKGYAIIGNGTGFKMASGSSKKAEKVIAKAVSYKGKVKYKFGAASPQAGVSDCSGFTSYIFKKAAGVSIGRTTGEQVVKGKKVAKKNLQKGDLVFFKNTYKSGYKYGVSHVGIYRGSGKFIHCSSSRGVTENRISESFYAKHWLMGRRVI